VFAFDRNELRHHGTNAEGFYVAAEDSAEEWSGEGGEDFFTEVAADEGGYGLVVSGAVARSCAALASSAA